MRSVILKDWGVPGTLDKSIKHADLVMLLTEHDNAEWPL